MTSYVEHATCLAASNLWWDTPSRGQRVKSRCHSSCWPLSFFNACWAQGCYIQRMNWISLELESNYLQVQCLCTTAHPTASKGRICPTYCHYQPRSSPFLQRDQLDHWKAYPFYYEPQLFEVTSLRKSCLASHEHIKCISHCFCRSWQGRLCGLAQ